MCPSPPFVRLCNLEYKNVKICVQGEASSKAPALRWWPTTLWSACLLLLPRQDQAEPLGCPGRVRLLQRELKLRHTQRPSVAWPEKIQFLPEYFLFWHERILFLFQLIKLNQFKFEYF